MTVMIKNKPRICMLVGLYKPYYSGRAKFLSGLIKELEKRGITSFILTTNNYNLKKKEIIDGIVVNRIKFSKKSLVGDFIFSLKIAYFLVYYLQ